VNQWFRKSRVWRLPVFGVAPGSVCCALIPFSIMSDRCRVRPPPQPPRNRSGNFGRNDRPDHKTISDLNFRFITVIAELSYSYPGLRSPGIDPNRIVETMLVVNSSWSRDQSVRARIAQQPGLLLRRSCNASQASGLIDAVGIRIGANIAS
jgi:hypothetical protein